MKIEIIVERTKTGYSTYAEKYPVYTVGATWDKLKTNMLEVLNFYFEEQGKTISIQNIKQ